LHIDNSVSTIAGFMEVSGGRTLTIRQAQQVISGGAWLSVYRTACAAWIATLKKNPKQPRELGTLDYRPPNGI
jgi:hypothetical protein